METLIGNLAALTVGEPSASRSGSYSIQYTVCAEILFNLWA